jgi:AcrR family transcriptional regulator
MRQIGRAAGAANIAAPQYHFGDRAGVIAAILEKHTPGVSRRRHELLDDYEAAPTGLLRDLVASLVRPAASKLLDPDGGCEYLRIYAELVNRPGGLGVPLVERPRNSIDRWATLVEPLLGRRGDPFHRRFIAIRINATELGRRATVRPVGDHELFLEHHIDLLTAMLQAPTGATTNALARRRSRQGGPPSSGAKTDREL